MRPFLYSYRFSFLGFSSITQNQQNQLNLDKHVVKLGLPGSSVIDILKVLSRAL